MGLVVLFPDLDALQEKGEAETLYLDGSGNLLGPPECSDMDSCSDISRQSRGVSST